jgi:hypothetical protein
VPAACRSRFRRGAVFPGPSAEWRADWEPGRSSRVRQPASVAVELLPVELASDMVAWRGAVPGLVSSAIVGRPVIVVGPASCDSKWRGCNRRGSTDRRSRDAERPGQREGIARRAVVLRFGSRERQSGRAASPTAKWAEIAIRWIGIMWGPTALVAPTPMRRSRPTR